MNTYWVNRIQAAAASIHEISTMPTERIASEIEWTVLGLLRQFFSLKEYDIVSKMDAGDNGLADIPVEWHPIIKEAMNIRKGIKVSAFSSEMERINQTLKFSKFLITYCNSMIVKN